MLTEENKVNSIVFVDPSVSDYTSLIAGVAPGAEVVILNPTGDVAKITEVLAQRSNISSIHIISHGASGSLQLGTEQLTLEDLYPHSEKQILPPLSSQERGLGGEVKQWSNALTQDADILIYGCNVASGEKGVAFVQQLSQLTGADVAASDDLTGSAALGGNWDLEVKTGKIEAPLAFQVGSMQAYSHILPVSFSGTYTQNFDSLANSGTSNAWTNDSTIEGWYATRSTYSGNEGSSNAGALYSFGQNSNGERSLGSIASGSTGTVYYGLRLKNTTGAPINTLQVGYTGEQWRNGGNTTAHKLSFSYQTGTTVTNLTAGTWTALTALDFTGPIATASAGALDGNNSSNRVVLSPITINLATPIANNEEVMLRWEDIDNTSNDHGLAIDDFSVSIPVVNNPPVLGVTGGILSYTENASATVIDSTATATDSDSTNFDTGTLTVNFTANGTADDRLAIRHEGNSAGQIGIDGRIVKYGGTQIGTFTGGIGTTPLVVTFNASATPTAAQALLRNITYQNISDNPATASRTVQFVLTDGDGGTSNAATKTINVTAVNDAPIVGAAVTRYDGSLNTTPDNNQGWSYLATGGTQSASGGATTLNTTANSGFGAGYFSNTGWTPVLDRTTGYTIDFTAQVVSEDHTTSGTADKNGDGIGDRAGFSIIALSNDKKGIELGFWQNEIWAQEDGTTQANPSSSPSTSSPGNTKLLFTHAEGATFNTTTGLIPYSLSVLGNNYTLSTGNTTILSGKLRDYTAFSGSPDPYETPNLIFLGDDNTSANANIRLSSVSVTTNSTLTNQVVNEDTDLILKNFSAIEVDSGSNNITANLTATNGFFTVNTGISGGVISVTNNGTNNITLTGTKSQINTTIAASGLVYRGNQDFYGTDTVNVTLNDGGFTGGGVLTNSKSFNITVSAVDDTEFVVTNTNDSGVGSLRQAIINANADEGTETIRFNISGTGVKTITPASALPIITNAVIIDGTTQPGFSATPLIQLSGSSAGAGASGLYITAGNSTVKGLVINQFSNHGIRLETRGDNIIQGNYIGTNAAGTASQGNAFHGLYITNSPNNTIGGTVSGTRNLISGNTGYGIVINGNGDMRNVIQGNYIGTNATGTEAVGNVRGVHIDNASNNTIGGTSPEARNIISGNTNYGVSINGSAIRNVVQGNYIGTDVNGTNALGNALYGVWIDNGLSNTIGGTLAGARNVISGNGQVGVSLSGSNASNNLVQGNYIGINANGNAALGNGLYGVEIFGTSYNTIGGTSSDARNVISGNNLYGISINGNSATENQIVGNYIGTQADGMSALGNTSHGIYIRNFARNNTIGGANGALSGAANRIAFNGGDGVFVESGFNNRILSNSIFSNTGLGIDLDTDGVTANDPSDSDMGANNLQNFPTVSSAIADGAYLHLTYNINGGNSVYPIRVEFFLSDGAGEGKTFLTSHNYSSPNFDQTFSLIPPVSVNVGDKIVATATDNNGNTSEFCGEVVVAAPDTTAPTASVTAANVTTAGAATYDFTVTYSDNVAVNVSSLDNSDIRVTGPNGFNQLATFVSLNTPGNGTPRTATYRINTPGGTWDAADVGTYTVQMEASQVRDTSNNNVAAGILGTFNVDVLNNPPALDLNGGGAGNNYSATFTRGGGAVAVVDSSNLTVTDSDSANMASATVTIANLQNGASEVLAVNNALASSFGIGVSYSGGVLNLTGSATKGQYEQVLRSVTYNNIADMPNTTSRIINFSINDGIANSAIATTTLTVNLPSTSLGTITATPLRPPLDTINDANPDDLYQFTLGGVSNRLQVLLTNSGGNADMALYDNMGNLILVANTATTSELIDRTGLAAGNYFLRVYQASPGQSVSYRLRLVAA